MSVGRDKNSSAATPGALTIANTGDLGELPDLEVADVFESPEYSATDYEMEATGDLA